MILSTFEIFCILNHFNYTSIILSNILRTIVCTSDIGRTLTEEKKTHIITDAQTKQLTNNLFSTLHRRTGNNNKTARLFFMQQLN